MQSDRDSSWFAGGSSLHVGQFDGPELWIGGFPWPESNLERLHYECDAPGCHPVEGNIFPGHIFAFSYGNNRVELSRS